MSTAAVSDERPANGLLRLTPNLLSLGRLLAGLAFPWLPAAWRLPAVGLAGLTDLADGYASRRFHARTVTGRLLDPVADKVFVLAVVGTLLAEGVLRPWECALVILRDVCVVAGALWVALHERDLAAGRIRPRFPGKLATALQFTFLVALLWQGEVWFPLLVATALVSGLAGADYLRVVFTGRYGTMAAR